MLRAAILTGKLAPGERLPSQHDLADRYGVARETVKTALRILRDERLIVTRQGSGAFVRAQTERPVGLRPHIEAAFERPHVSIDFAGFSGETLHGAMAEPLDKIRAGRLAPESIAVRILLPDLSVPAVHPVPRRTAPPTTRPSGNAPSGSPAGTPTPSSTGAASWPTSASSATPPSRSARTARRALFKLYILNGEEVFFGFYPVVDQHRLDRQASRCRSTTSWARTCRCSTTPQRRRRRRRRHASSSQQARSWFDSVWTTIAHEYTAMTAHRQLADLLAHATPAARLRRPDLPPLRRLPRTGRRRAAPRHRRRPRRHRARPPPDDDGPLQVLRLVADLNDDQLTRRVADALRDAEVDAAASATLTDGAVEVLDAARASGRRVAVVSNNAVEAVRSYLRAHGLTDSRGRWSPATTAWTPGSSSPTPTSSAWRSPSWTPPPRRRCSSGTRSATSEAGQAAGLPTIGYANKPGKRQALVDAGAAIVIDTLAELPTPSAPHPGHRDRHRGPRRPWT